jgi:hypothetical protein
MKMTTYNSERAERIEREYKKWEEKYEIPFEQEFEVRTIIELQDEFRSVPEDHTKRRSEIINMITHLKGRIRLKEMPLGATIYKKVLITSRNRGAIESAYDLIHSLVGDRAGCYFSEDSNSRTIRFKGKVFKFQKKSETLRGSRFDLCLDLDNTYDSNRIKEFSKSLDSK